MLQHLPHYFNPRNADVGALVVFGPGTGHHVCQVHEPGADPWLFSHGQESDPCFIRLSEMRAGQPSPATFLAISKL